LGELKLGNIWFWKLAKSCWGKGAGAEAEAGKEEGGKAKPLDSSRPNRGGGGERGSKENEREEEGGGGEGGSKEKEGRSGYWEKPVEPREIRGRDGAKGLIQGSISRAE